MVVETQSVDASTAIKAKIRGDVDRCLQSLLNHFPNDEYKRAGIKIIFGPLTFALSEDNCSFADGIDYNEIGEMTDDIIGYLSNRQDGFRSPELLACLIHLHEAVQPPKLQPSVYKRLTTQIVYPELSPDL